VANVGRRGTLLALALALAGAGGARADGGAPGHHARRLVLTAGAGNQYAGLGVGAHLLLPLSRPFSLGTSLAVGVAPNLFGEQALDRASTRVAGLAVAVSASVGYRHRMTADVGFGSGGALGIPVQGVYIDAVPLYSAFLQVGYEFVGVRGFMFRICPLGVAVFTSGLLAPGERVSWAGSLAAGWKIW
jgi:hypothetical protein